MAIAGNTDVWIQQDNEKIIVQPLGRPSFQKPKIVTTLTGDTLRLCAQCNVSFQTEEELSDHMRLRHKWVQLAPGEYVPKARGDFRCSEPGCDKQFRYRHNLRRHMLWHKGEKPFHCESCPMRFYERSDLKNHSKVHAGRPLIPCPKCDKMFKRPKDLRAHMDSHNEEKLYSCEHCGKRFQRRLAWKHHQQIHRTDNHLKCKHCDAGFRLSRHFYQHNFTEHADLCPKCKMCHKPFLGEDTLHRHYLVKHGNNDPYQCKECSQFFTGYDGLMQHAEEAGHTLVEHLPFHCTACEQNFHNIEDLLEHGETHADDHIFKCGRCGFTTPNLPALKAHRAKLHPIARKDPEAGKAAAGAPKSPRKRNRKPKAADPMRPKPLLRKQSEEGGAPYKCVRCDVFFSTLPELRSHAQLDPHDNIPHRCKICGFTTHEETAFQKHNQVHELRERQGVKEKRAPLLECPECDKTFAWDRSVRKHFQQTHIPGFTGHHHRKKLNQMYDDHNPELTCEKCGFRFANSKTLKKHRERMVCENKERGVLSEPALKKSKKQQGKKKQQQQQQQLVQVQNQWGQTIMIPQEMVMLNIEEGTGVGTNTAATFATLGGNTQGIVREEQVEEGFGGDNFMTELHDSIEEELFDGTAAKTKRGATGGKRGPDHLSANRPQVSPQKRIVISSPARKRQKVAAPTVGPTRSRPIPPAGPFTKRAPPSRGPREGSTSFTPLDELLQAAEESRIRSPPRPGPGNAAVTSAGVLDETSQAAQAIANTHASEVPDEMFQCGECGKMFSEMQAAEKHLLSHLGSGVAQQPQAQQEHVQVLSETVVEEDHGYSSQPATTTHVTASTTAVVTQDSTAANKLQKAPPTTTQQNPPPSASKRISGKPPVSAASSKTTLKKSPGKSPGTALSKSTVTSSETAQHVGTARAATGVSLDIVPADFADDGDDKNNADVMSDDDEADDVAIDEFNQSVVDDDVNDLTCEECGIKSTTKHGLKKHVMWHLKEKKPFECNICHKGFKLVTQMVKHRNTHAKSQAFECDWCLEAFMHKGQLQEHRLLVHEGAKPLYECEQCGQGFMKEQRLRHHVMTSHPGRHVCEECDKEFPNEFRLEEHVVSVHERKFPCKFPYCRLVFDRHALLMEHCKSAHDGKTGPYQCDLCDKVLGSQYRYDVHRLAHGTQQPTPKTFVCGFCQKAFARRDYLKVHMFGEQGCLKNKLNPALDGTPRQCFYCKTICKRNEEVASHLMSHFGNKVYTCAVCSKDFGGKTHLEKHMLVHSGKKPLGCPVCDKKFARESTLTEHLRSHSGEKPFECELCGKAYARKEDMKKHIAKIHEQGH